MRKMIGEMDILVAQLSSELKFIKNGMILSFFVHSTCVSCKHFGIQISSSSALVSMLLLHLLSANAGHVNVKFIEIQVLIFQHCPPLQLLLA